MDQGDAGGEAGQECGLFDGGIPAADDGNVLVAEEEAVAGGAPGDAPPGQAILVVQTEAAVARTGGQDDGLGTVDAALGVGDGLDRARELHLDNVVGDDLRAEALGLGAHVVHQIRALDAFWEPGKVLHLGGVHQRAAGGDGALEDQRLEVGPGGVDGGGVAGRSAADDDDLARLAASAVALSVVRGGGSAALAEVVQVDHVAPGPTIFVVVYAVKRAPVRGYSTPWAMPD